MKVITLAILSLLVISSVSAQGCQVFSCGNIKQEGETRTCIQQDGENPTFAATKCDNADHTCQAFTWNSPADATANSLCGVDSFIKTFPPTFELVAGAGLDGDWCEEDANCFTSDLNTATCNGNVCKASTNTNDACTIDDDCKRGHGCTDSKCAKLLEKGDTCVGTLECNYLLDCVKIKGAENLVCTEAFSLNDGDEFTVPAMTHTNLGADLQASVVCSSGFQIVVDGGMQCRQADRSVSQEKEGRSTPEPGKTCDFNSYTTEAAAEFATPIVSQATSFCGFNQDNLAYCQVHAGDDEIMEVMKDIRGKKMNCHRLSGRAGSTCADLREVMISNLGFRFYKAGVSMGEGQAAANIANNDNCVAETVMSNLWQGHFGDSALTYGVFGVCASLLASILF